MILYQCASLLGSDASSIEGRRKEEGTEGGMEGSERETEEMREGAYLKKDIHVATK